MKFDRYAGMASAVGIVLILMIVAWLDLWGPVELSRLKDWQTLIAGMVALIAAGIAYRGATAKVRHDREIVASENMRRKLSLYLKLEFAFRQLADKARSKRPQLFSFEKRIIAASDFAIEEPPELDEAWMYLDVFPRRSIAEIRNVRNSLRKLAAIGANLGSKRVHLGHPRDYETPAPSIIREVDDLIVGIWYSAAHVADELAPLIQELVPEIEESERLIENYDEPEVDDESEVDEK